ncbi:MAG TPA: hypothetical protein ENI07_11510 [Desulfobacterales bacterium]|nr:hypothetical protein [Desulfobacterales bacterium]
MTGMGIGLLVFILMFLVLGIGMYFLVQGSGKRYIIAGKSLPFFQAEPAKLPATSMAKLNAIKSETIISVNQLYLLK